MEGPDFRLSMGTRGNSNKLRQSQRWRTFSLFFGGCLCVSEFWLGRVNPTPDVYLRSRREYNEFSIKSKRRKREMERNSGDLSQV